MEPRKISTYLKNSPGSRYSCIATSVHTLSVDTRLAIGKAHDLRAQRSQKSGLVPDSNLAKLSTWSWSFADTKY